MVFKIGKEQQYALDFDVIDRIIHDRPITPVPGIHPLFSGLLYYNTEIWPVINLKVLFNCKTPDQENNFILLYEGTQGFALSAAAMNHETNEILYERVFNTIPIGLFLVSHDYTIYAWNTWMVDNTHIPVEKAVGQTLHALSSEALNPRFEWALEAALNNGHPQILSSTFNKHIFKIPPVKDAYPAFDKMQQHVEILPVLFRGQNMALVVIQDVTDNVHLKKTLVSMGARLEETSLVDTLTGLYNRRFLWKHLTIELQNAYREGYTVICCLFDIDHFKKINDKLGHAAGDEVLCSFAKIAQSILRPHDYLVRYGGEEFLLILTKITTKNAINVLNRLRKKIESRRSHGSINIKITCSGGVAFWHPSDPLISAEKLVQEADVELYKAKNSGRNRISPQDAPVR